MGFEGGTGLLTAVYRRTACLEREIKADRDTLLNILNRMTDGVLIIGPDYRVKFTNEVMKKRFGTVNGLPCYTYIFHNVEPCAEKCRLRYVIAGATERWEYIMPDGTAFEAVASPYTDVDGTE